MLTVRGEVSLLELKLLNRKALGDNLLGLVTADGNMGRDFLVTADTESTHSVPSCK